ncbi:MAG TPA: oxidoreductase, partial [Microlunatus sp.]|nr:oxidoreductase [Microlunatus sp.]
HPGAYDAVTSGTWDAVLDLSRQPGHVRRAVAALEPVAARYLFVSSASAYASHRDIGQQEDAALLPPLEADVMSSMEEYGPAKVACEEALTATFGAERSLIARVGLIGGPGDWSGRSGYWPWRFARPSDDEGLVLVPDAPDLPVAVLDVRDCAGWLVDCAAGAVTGVFNVGGEVLSLADHLAAARTVAEHTGELVAAPGEWLIAHDVANWAGPRSLPLWLPDPDWHGLNARDTTRARAAGLRTRPPAETLSDVLSWELARPEPGPHGAGLTDAEERELIASFRRRSGQRPK